MARRLRCISACVAGFLLPGSPCFFSAFPSSQRPSGCLFKSQPWGRGQRGAAHAGLSRTFGGCQDSGVRRIRSAPAYARGRGESGDSRRRSTKPSVIGHEVAGESQPSLPQCLRQVPKGGGESGHATARRRWGLYFPNAAGRDGRKPVAVRSVLPWQKGELPWADGTIPTQPRSSSKMPSGCI